MIRPSVRLGKPKESELMDYQELEMFNPIKLYIHASLLNLKESYQPKIDVHWTLIGKCLVVKGM